MSLEQCYFALFFEGVTTERAIGILDFPEIEGNDRKM